MPPFEITTPDEILQRLGQEVGISGLGFNPNGGCTLDLGDRFVHLELHRQSYQLSMYTTVAVLPTPVPVHLLELMMRANYFTLRTAGATLGLDGAEGMVVLYLRIDTAALAYERFIERFESFVEASDYWALRLVDPAPAEPSTPEAAPDRNSGPPWMMVQG